MHQRPVNQTGRRGTTAQRQPRPSCGRCSLGGLIKSSEMCVMLHVSTGWQSTAQYWDPLNRAPLPSTFLSPLTPSLHSPSFPSPTLLYLTQLSNPLSLFFLRLLLSSFCSFVPLWHIPQARRGEGETEGERMERRRNKKRWGQGGGGGWWESQRQECRSFFILLLRREGWEELSQQRGEPGDQRQTESDRDEEAAKRMQRETPPPSEGEHISLLILCQLDFSHPHFLIFWQISGQILFTSFVHLNLSGLFFLSDKEPCWWVITTTASAQISQAALEQRVLYLVWL